jgi:hypothetical protein
VGLVKWEQRRQPPPPLRSIPAGRLNLDKANAWRAPETERAGEASTDPWVLRPGLSMELKPSLSLNRLNIYIRRPDCT